MPPADAAVVNLQKGRSPARAVARLGAAAVAWGAVVCWCFVVFRGDGLGEAAKAAFWLLQALGAYLGALTVWVLFNRVRRRMFGPVPRLAGEDRAFDKDYYGRAVAVAPGADFAQQHLVLEYVDNQKVYRAPNEDEAGLRPAAASDGLKALAAAVGAGAAPQLANGTGPSEASEAAVGSASLEPVSAAHHPEEAKP